MSHDIRTPLMFDDAGMAGERNGPTFTFRPIYDRLLVRVIPQRDREWNGLILPAYAMEGTPHIRAEVLAAGRGRITADGTVAPMEVKPGDIVTFVREREAQMIMPSAPGTELMVIREHHVMGIFDDLPRATGVLGADGREQVS